MHFMYWHNCTSRVTGKKRLHLNTQLAQLKQLTKKYYLYKNANKMQKQARVKTRYREAMRGTNQSRGRKETKQARSMWTNKDPGAKGLSEVRLGCWVKGHSKSGEWLKAGLKVRAAHDAGDGWSLSGDQAGGRPDGKWNLNQERFI